MEGIPYGGYSRSDKFLGKEVSFYELIYRNLNLIQFATAGGDTKKYVSLVNHLEASFPYKDKTFLETIAEAEQKLKEETASAYNKYGHTDNVKRDEAILIFTHIKYNALIELFKRKRIFPQEAQVEELSADDL